MSRAKRAEFVLAVFPVFGIGSGSRMMPVDVSPHHSASSNEVGHK